MSEIINCLNKVSARLSEEAFLSNKGLSNEVGIHVFCYDPEDELTVRAYFDTLKKQQDVPYNLVERDLYKIFLEICEGKRILKSIPNMEDRKGKEYLSEQLQKVATPEAFVEKMKYEPKVFKYIFGQLNPTLNFQSGEVAKFPVVYVKDIQADRLAVENVRLSRSEYDNFETSWDFKKHPLV